MDFSIKNKISISDLSRRLGYLIIDAGGNGKYNLVRKFSRDNYPRFHLYLTQQGDNYNFSLHLDQKKPIYGAKGVHAHNGEYFGPVVETEADRIKEILKPSLSGAEG